MTHRIAVAGLHMECATFLPHVITRDVFEASTVRGKDLVQSFLNSNTVMGGFLKTLEQAGMEVVPILHSDGGAAGLADQAAVAAYRQEILLDVDGIKISVTTLAQSAIDFDPFLQFGLDPADFDIILLRSKTHFRAAWEDFAADIIIIDTPDYGPADISKLPYRHANP